MIPTCHFREDKQFQLFNENPQSSSSSPPPLSSHPFTYSIQDQEGCDNRSELHHIEYQQQDSNFAMNGGSHDHHHSNSGLKLSLWKTEEGNENERDWYGSAKVMPFKLRLMRKMSTDQMKFGDQKQQSSPTKPENSSNNNPIRVCSDCNTTKTPLWRSGPRGPKSLCNACGIRQRKARRTMAAAAAAANGTTFETKTVQVKTKVQHVKAKRSKYGHVAQFKKRSKLATNSTTSHGLTKKLCFEDFLISLSKNSAFHQVFPQDEKDAAILLMALSCGLVHG